MTLVIEGIRYQLNPDLDVEFQTTYPDGIEIRARLASGAYVQRLVNQCSHCHRADLEVVVCSTLAEAVEQGWLAPTDHDPLLDPP